MEFIIGKTAGFCFGVANAVNKTKEQLKNKKNIFCLGELVHNKQVTEQLEAEGLVFIDDIEIAKQDVIIRAHGEKKETYSKANALGLNIIDLTCPKVTRIHQIAEEYSNKGYYIFLIGNKKHPETIATISYCGNNSCIIENEKDIKFAIKNLYLSEINKLVILSQTTFSLEKFNKMVELVSNHLENKDIELEIKKTICDATRLRQEETKELSSKVDMMIIIGGRHSSNTNKLYEIAKINCANSILIENSEELAQEQVKGYNKIGIMAGASTPKKSIESVVEMLNELC